MCMSLRNRSATTVSSCSLMTDARLTLASEASVTLRAMSSIRLSP